MEYTKVESTVTVPKNTGVSGFLATIRGILQKPRILSININDKGVVTYVRAVKEGEDVEPIDIEFSSLIPSSVIRACQEIVEVNVFGLHAGTAIAQVFNASAIDQMVPIAFCANSATWLWQWFQGQSGLTFARKDEFFGLPMYYDDNLPDTALFLCTAYERSAALVDTRKVYKITLM